ncbi:hypothetical protein WJX77_000595 [Trebouxia sp. C0004]
MLLAGLALYSISALVSMYYIAAPQAQQTREQFSSESSRFWLPAFVALDIRHGRKIEPDSSITSWFIWSMNQIIRFVLTTRQPVLT